MIDKEEIVRALTLWFQPGDVFEIRALDAVTGQNLRCHTESGYFDYEHIAEAADAIAKIRSAAGIYVTINPVKRDLLARAVYKLRDAKRSPLTADTNIERRHWLLIDCDPVRISGIASNDAEHEAAIAKAKEIRDGLASMGWPSPILTDSGNGAHLTYRIDIPADDGNLVQKAISAIAATSSKEVDIDLSVFNPARIVRLPGTMNCKGDDADGKACGRPHRMAKILEVPESIVPVTEEQLRIVAGMAEAQMEPELDYSDFDLYDEGPKFDAEEWVAKYAPEVIGPFPYQDGRKWIFHVCPFNPEHTNHSAAMFQFGTIMGFGCRHNSCKGNNWKKFRPMREPGCYDHLPKEYPDVDVSGILAQKPKTAQKIEMPVVKPEICLWREVTNEQIEKILQGTFLWELTKIYASVTRPPLPIEAALLKAVVTAGCCLTGEASQEELQRRYGSLGGFNVIGADRAKVKINTAGGQLCNVYGMIVANSASGKDIGGLIGKFAHFPNPDIKFAEKNNVKPDWNLGTSGSAEGLASLLTKKPNGLLNISEMSKWLDKDNWQYKATGFLTETFGQGFFDQNFSDRCRGNSNRSSDYCAPNIIANMQPNVFEKLVRMVDLDTGFLGRFLFARMPEFYGNPARFDSIELMKRMQGITNIFLKKSGVVELDEHYADDIQKVFEGHCDPKLNPSWRRLCCEYYPWFMVMLSISGDPASQDERIIITEEVMTKAKALTMWFFAQAEKVLGNIIDAEGNGRDVEHKLKRLFEIVRDHDTGQGLLTSEISTKASGSGTTAKMRRELLQELCDRQWIQFENGRYSVLNPPPALAKLRKKVRRPSEKFRSF